MAFQIGEKAPDFTAHDQDGKDFVLSEHLAKGPVVLYFYPKDFTLVCTQEACLFRDSHAEMAALDAEVVGVSLDGEEQHRAFRAEHRLPFTLLSDADGSIVEAYAGKRFLLGGARRITYVIDRDRTVRAAIQSELSASKHVEEAHKALKAIRAKAG